jgi:cation-transporting ATPase E
LAARGLTEAEAARRLAARPLYEPATSRSYASIVRANVLTVFNLILALAGAATLTFGAWQDALFLGVLVSNSAIGIGQEVRAKRALDSLATLVAPTATVVRDGESRRILATRVVEGDLVLLAAGDGVVADGELQLANGLTLDESILTGESRPTERRQGETVRSGSFVVEGVGEQLVEAVGADSYAARVTGEARAFRHPRSPLERALNKLLLTLVAIIVPLGLVLGSALWERDAPISEAVPTSVAAVVTLVPEGLILLVSLTYAVSALRMAQRGALAQQLNAVESLAAVDVVCLDKTGTLTEPRLRVVELVGDGRPALDRYAASAPGRNATLTAIAEAFPATAETPEEVLPFTSRRRFGALRLDGESYVLGAPELFALGPYAERAAAEATGGRRVLAFGRSTAATLEEAPAAFEPLSLVLLAEHLRPDAVETVAFFRDQGVELKILSGDRPETVAAIAGDVGLGGEVADGRSLPENEAALRRLVEASAAVGRIAPEDKRRVVEALTNGGRYVAMVGDGVNDVPALKAARLAIAQGSGTEMARSVADVVLVRGGFGVVPPMVAEGRRLLRNLQRVAKLFVTKSVFASVLIVSVGLTPIAYPLLPRHLTLAASLTIGLPAFFLALAPSSGNFSSTSFLRDVAHFAVPAGTAAALGVLAGYFYALNVLDFSLIEARTVATTTLVAIGLYLVVALEARGRTRSTAVGGLVAAMAGGYFLVLALKPLREFFALAVPTPGMLLVVALAAAFAVTGLVLTSDEFVPGRRTAP